MKENPLPLLGIETSAIFLDEFYVMNYLRAMMGRHDLGRHPLSTRLHLTPQLAFAQLFRVEGLKTLADTLGCPPKQAFSQLRRLLDQWDGVSAIETARSTTLTPDDENTLLFDELTLKVASQYLGCSPAGVLGMLFDPSRIFSDCDGVIPAINRYTNLTNQLRCFHRSPENRQRVRRHLGKTDWWSVLDRWIKPETRDLLSARLKCPRGQEVRSLFERVKGEVGPRDSVGSHWQQAFQDTSLGRLLPESSERFWLMLAQLGGRQPSQIGLDVLDEAKLTSRKPDENAREALRIAQNFMNTQITPVESEFTRVDVFGMIALRHRFQGTVDELLGNALYYSTLASEDLVFFNRIRQAIQYYCHGEYRNAINSMFSLKMLPVRALGFEYQVSNKALKPIPGSSLVAFSTEDMRSPTLLSGLRWGQGRPSPKPPRIIEPGELLIAYVENDKTPPREILSLKGLSNDEVHHLKSSVPSVDTLSPIGDSIGERLLNTPIPVSPQTQRLGEALQSIADQIVRCVILGGVPLPQMATLPPPNTLAHRVFHGGAGLPQAVLKPSPNIFGKVIEPLSSATTIRAETNMDSLKKEIISEYRAKGRRLDVTTGF